jgi:hypothetical protein
VEPAGARVPRWWCPKKGASISLLPSFLAARLRGSLASIEDVVAADLVQLEPHHRGLYALLAKKAEFPYSIPGSLRRHVAQETIRG